MSAFFEATCRLRSRLNAAFAEAKRHSPGLDGEAFLEHLRRVVGPTVDLRHEVAPTLTEELTLALFDASLTLTSTGHLGPDAPASALLDAWQRLLPLAERSLAPRTLVATLSNAVLLLQARVSDNVQRWISGMERVMADCTLDELQKVGLVLAWMSGLAEARAAALDALSALPAPLCLRALDLPPEADARALINMLRSSRWFLPTRPWSPPRLTTAAKLGGFRGFGGPFLVPPTLAKLDGQWLATDGRDVYAVHVDAFGAELRHTSAPLTAFSRLPGPGPVIGDGKVQAGGQTLSLGQLGPLTSAAEHEDTVLVTSALSHYIWAVALVPHAP